LDSTLFQALLPLIFLLVVVMGTGVFLLWRRLWARGRERNDSTKGVRCKLNASEARSATPTPLKVPEQEPPAEMTQCPSCGTKFLYRKNPGTTTFCPNCESPYPKP